MSMRQSYPKSLIVIYLVLCLIGTVSLVGCMSSSYQPFRLVSWDDLVYPEEAKKSKITGTVTVQYDIQADGKVTNVSVVEADPPEVFDTEALRYVRTWVFRPAKKNGIAVVTENVESDITFKLADLMDDPPDY